MASKEVYLTPEGRRKLQEELEYLRSVKRPEVAEKIHTAKEAGDIMENAAYEEAKHQQAFVEGRILTVKSMLNNAVIIEDSGPSETVRLGSRVIVVERGYPVEQFRIVGSAEADPGKGLISNESPLGKALLNRRVGDEVAVQTPDGTTYFSIQAIE